MRRLRRDPGTFDLLHTIAAWTRHRGQGLRDPATAADAFQDLKSQFVKRQSDDKLFHGQRTEILFAYVTAALGGCCLIKSEDAGEVYSADDDLRVPDYRLITTNGRQLLVEVKNFHAADPQRPFQIRTADLRGLEKYATALGCELFLAIYWSRWKQWTLITPGVLHASGEARTISMIQAIPRSQMSILGDRLLGTVPSLALRLVSSSEDDQAIGKNGECQFTTRAVELYCGDQRIEDPLEQRIAWFLMMNGNWEVSARPTEMDGARVAAITYVVEPPERANPDQEFEFIGRLSDMVSRQFDAATVTDGEVVNISPVAEPEAFGVAIPTDYKGSVLRLWLIEQRTARR
jgi:hypothetical protein